MYISKNVKDISIIDEYDVVVAGGGLAGFGAACAAARSSVKTLLIERLEQLGGLGSSGGVGNFSYGHEHVKGQGKVFDDIIAGLKSMNAIGEENGFRAHSNELFNNYTFDHNVLPIVLQNLAKNYGVDLLFATDVIGVNMKEKNITEILIHNRSLIQAIKGNIFIDGTGDGILSRHAEGEILPVDDPELSEMLKPSFMIFLHKSDNSQKQVLLECNEDSEDNIDYSLWPEPDKMGLKTKMFEYDFDTGSGKGYSDTLKMFRERVPEFVRHFQENHDDDYVFDYAAPMLGLREGRRIKGDYILRVKDVRNGQRFDDSIAYATSCLDVSAAEEKPIVPPYQIPYRSIIVQNVKNLFVVGRCFSCDRLVLSSARVMATCCLMGQSAGYGAAISLMENKSIREVDTLEIRKRLLEDAKDLDVMKKRLVP